MENWADKGAESDAPPVWATPRFPNVQMKTVLALQMNKKRRPNGRAAEILVMYHAGVLFEAYWLTVFL